MHLQYACIALKSSPPCPHAYTMTTTQAPCRPAPPPTLPPCRPQSGSFATTTPAPCRRPQRLTSGHQKGQQQRRPDYAANNYGRYRRGQRKRTGGGGGTGGRRPPVGGYRGGRRWRGDDDDDGRRQRDLDGMTEVEEMLADQALPQPDVQAIGMYIRTL